MPLHGVSRSRAPLIAAASVLLLLATAPLSSPAVPSSPSVPLTPVGLRCEYAVNPLGIDALKPRLSWGLQAEERGERQSAFRILAATSPLLLAGDNADLWDSGKVPSDETHAVAYNGRPLRSFDRVYWKVQVWSRGRVLSPWSETAEWTMGVLRPAEWRAAWIGAPPASVRDYETLLLRQDIKVRPGLRRASVFVCGLGAYEMSIDGRPLGPDALALGWTKFDKTCLYDAYDVTEMLKPGRHALGLLLGNGFFNVHGGRYAKYTGTFGPLRAIVMLKLDYPGGATEFIGSNGTWRAHPGPITFSCIYGGEDYDARLEPAGWRKPGFNDSAWSRAAVLAGPGGVLKGAGAAAPPLRFFELLSPASVKSVRPGVEVFDLGQNAPIMLRLIVRGQPGSRVRVTPAELLAPDGTVDRRSCGGGEAYWQYTAASLGRETYRARFFYNGARFLQAERLPAFPGGPLPEILRLEAAVVHSGSAPAGEFACSFDLFNRIRTLVRWAQRANMMSVLTDCPHREKLGWLEQYHLNGPSLRYEWDLTRLYAKTMGDMADSQLENGLVPDIAPEYTVFSRGFRDSPEWGSAAVIVPWQEYEWTGDATLLARHFPVMKRYVDYLSVTARANIVSHGLGDWYDLGPKPPGEAQLTPKALTATAFYYYDTLLVSRAAAMLGRADESAEYAARAADIREAFNARFFDPVSGSYGADSQTANAIPLVMGLAPETRRADILEAIVKDVRRRGDALTAGDVGYRYLLRALADGGRSDVVFDMNSRSDKPGYGFQMEKGATSLTEAWDADPRSSQNHFMLGHIMEWFYADVAGIRGDPAGPGFKKFIVAPQPAGKLTWARAGLETVRGRIEADWKIENGRFRLAVIVPPNTEAAVHIPAGKAADVTEGGVRASDSPGVETAGMERGRAVFKVGSGRYTFEAPWK